jgi:hypothetical protein
MKTSKTEKLNKIYAMFAEQDKKREEENPSDNPCTYCKNGGAKTCGECDK